MPTSARTANQIISSVLKRIGNETITTEAQAEFANIVTRLCEDFRWPFLRGEDTGTLAAGDTSVALPTDFADFWNKYSLHLIDASTGNHIPVRTVSQNEFDSYISPDGTGTPRQVIVDWANQTWRVYPLAQKSYSYQLVYRTVPARITNFDAVVDFPNDALLTQLLFVWACQHEDDDRYTTEIQVADKMLRQYMKRFNLSPTKQLVAALSPGTFSPINPIR